VRTVAAIPAGALLAGAACGFLFTEPPVVVGCTLLASSVAGALCGRGRGRRFLFATSVAVGFFAGAVLLSSTEWQRAWRPSLRVAFEDLALEERRQAAVAGRRVPEDFGAFTIVEGTLRADASPGASGVSLSVLVDRVEGAPPAAIRRDEAIGQPPISGSANQRRRPRAGEETPGGLDRHSIDVHGGILVTVVGSLAAERTHEWREGRRVRFPVQLRRPSRYLNPGVPDHERALARRGTTLVGSVKSGGLVEIVAHGSWIDEWLGAVRAFARQALSNAVGRWSARSAGIVSAVVIGDRAGLEADVERQLQEAGTYHVIAISGGNIAILVGLLLGAFRVAGWLGRAAMFAAIAVLMAYARLVGGGASVDRATLMAVVYLAARAFDQRAKPLNAIACVAGILIASDPLSIVDPAFLLTFGATFAIVLTVPVIAAGPASLRLLAAMLAASAAAEAMLFPIGAALFSRVTFAGLALNFLAIPLMAVAQIAGMLVVPLALVSPHLAAAAGLAAHAGAAGLVWSAQLVQFAPLLTYRIAPPAPWIVAVYYLATAAAWILWRHRVAHGSAAESNLARRLFGRRGAEGTCALRVLRLQRCQWSLAALRSMAAVSVASGLWILADPWSLVVSRGDGRLHLTFLDVGQGDAIFVRFPNSTTLLVDAGGLGFSSTFDIGDRVVAPVIRHGGFYRLDYMALTHGDPDHIGGARSVVEEFRPREVWEGIPVPRSASLASLRNVAQARGARWANVYDGDYRSIDGVAVAVRHPPRAEWERQKVRNDDSIVLELRWRGVEIFLTGDIGRPVEAMLARTRAPAPLGVMKVPHHGSLTSSTRELITAMRPKVAVVSAGRGNHFGHPVPEVLERYRTAGAEVFRTDRDGAVTVVTDGATLEVTSFTGRRTSFR
jgi:competence protein ComEC